MTRKSEDLVLDNLRFIQHNLLKNEILKSNVESYSEKTVEYLSNMINSYKLNNVDYEIYLLNKQQRNLIIIKWDNDYDIGDCLYTIIDKSSYYTVEKTYSHDTNIMKALSIINKYINNRPKRIKKLRSIGALNENNFILRKLTLNINYQLGEIDTDLDNVLEKILSMPS